MEKLKSNIAKILCKSKYVIQIFCLTFLVKEALAQDQKFTPITPPDVREFLTSNYLPIDESTGKMDVTIPIYEISLDGMTIPISLSYNTGGIKVNSSASSIGLNWSLNAGGVISKEIKGVSDIDISLQQSNENGPGDVYTSYGFLRHLLTWSFPGGADIAEPYRDTQPDLFHVMAPGLSTKFTHKSNGKPFEINNTNTFIKSPFNNPTQRHNFYWRHKLKPGFSFELTPPNGYIYSFNEVGFNAIKTKMYGNTAVKGTMYAYGNEYPGISPGSPIDIWYYNQIPDGLSEPILPISITEQQIENGVYSYGIYYAKQNNWISDLYPTIHLSEIKSPISKRKVSFYYEDNPIVDNDRRIERNYQGTTKIGQINYEHDYTRQKVLKKIDFPEGNVIFYYDSNRLDVRGGKILKKIEIRNNSGILVKGVLLKHSYFTSVENCNYNHCYRLKLDAVKFFDKNDNFLPGYKFEYDNTKLPKRFSVEQDFTGYYNGQSGISEESYLPKIYYKTKQGKNSFLPFPCNGYQLFSNGNASLLPNLKYSKAASLNKITYPSGGYSIFDYELHSFSFLNEQKPSGGLRVKKQSLYNANNTIEKTITYDYSLSDGSSSGMINNVPIYYSYNFSLGGNKTRFSQVTNTRQQLTKNSYVSYSRVKISENNNGYVINEYSNIDNYPNEYPTYNLPNSYKNELRYKAFLDVYDDGIYPYLYKDYSIKRGKLLSSKFFNKKNKLLKSITNEYEYKNYDSFQISENVIFGHANFKYTKGNGATYAQFNINLTSERNNLTKTVTKEYDINNRIISNEKNYTYHANKPFVSEIKSKLSNGKYLTKKHLYPFDNEVSSMPNISTLNELNILHPIKTSVFRENIVLSTALTEYHNFGEGKILPKTLKKNKSTGNFNINKIFHNYDKRGNLIEFSKEDGTYTTILWGYNYQYKIAEVIGANYKETLGALNISNLDELQNLSNNALKNKMNKLRNNLKKAMVYSYTHIPLVGISEITQPNGYTHSYNYDSFLRLESIQDNENNLLKSINYNYKLKPTIETSHKENLSLTIVKKPIDQYTPSQNALIRKTLLIANVSGGKGDYSYEWTTSSSPSILSTSSKYIIDIPCNNSLSLQLKVKDSENNLVTQNIVVRAAKCGEPFYVGEIEGDSYGNNKNDFKVNAEGGSYKFTYTWYIAGSPPVINSTSYDNKYPDSESNLLLNTTGKPVTVNLEVKVTDEVSGYYVIRNRTVTIKPEFEINSCFIKGTKITMADGSQKNIENIVLGEKILTYNTSSKMTEIGKVENIVTPNHTTFINFKFENEIENTNTLDHPYFVKGKEWSSYNPEMTMIKYGLKVNKIELGDIMFFYDKKENKVRELKLLNQELITKTQKTFNLDKVSKNHNFFANGILVHNKSSEDFINSHLKK